MRVPPHSFIHTGSAEHRAIEWCSHGVSPGLGCTWTEATPWHLWFCSTPQKHARPLQARARGPERLFCRWKAEAQRVREAELTTSCGSGPCCLGPGPWIHPLRSWEGSFLLSPQGRAGGLISACWGFEIPEMKDPSVGGPSLCGLPVSMPGICQGPQPEGLPETRRPQGCTPPTRPGHTGSVREVRGLRSPEQAQAVWPFG